MGKLNNIDYNHKVFKVDKLKPLFKKDTKIDSKN